MSLPKLILDNRDEEALLDEAYSRVVNASGGVLNAKQPGSALMALLEGQTYLTAELLWFMNKLPEATAIEILRLTGVERILGTKASGTLLVTLELPLGTPFIMSAGTVLGGYVLTNQVFIPPGVVEGVAIVEALVEGSQGNADPYQVRLGAVTTYVKDVFNPGAIVGGSDLEPMESYIDRLQASFRRRDTLVSAEDYSQAAISFIGGSTVATATTIPLLMADKVSKAVGNAHIFVALFDRKVPSSASLQVVRDNLSERVMIGTSVHVSAVTYFEVDIDVVVKVLAISDATAIKVYEAVDNYFRPGIYRLGETISVNEVEYLVRGVEGVERVSTCYIQNDGLDVGMPSPYSLPVIGTLAVTMVDRLGQSDVRYLGLGTGDTN